MEVLAKKAKPAFLDYFNPAVSVLALVIGILYLCVIPVSEQFIVLKYVLGIGGIVVGACYLALSAKFFISYFRLPQDLIAVEGEVLHIAKTTCKLSDITEVKAIPMGKFGMLEFTVNGKKIKCEMVDGAVAAAEQIRALLDKNSVSEEKKNG